jgi:phosphate transport system substrate-binding protein
MKRSLFVILGLALAMMAHDSMVAQTQLNGAGATFPYPIYSKWFDVYSKQHGINFNYQAIGSGGGIKQVTEGTVDFGASDAFLGEDQMKEIYEKQHSHILHFPTVMGAVVLTYNLPGVGDDLKMTPEVLADIYLGKITKWNDEKITSINPDKKLPDMAILVAHRSDGSGTTNIFTNYLCKVSPEWKEKVGQGTSVSWPVGLGGKGNDGVTGVVKQSEGGFGYVEIAYAIQNHMPYCLLKNEAGKFVGPTLEALSAAAAGAAANMPKDLRVMITNSPGAKAYPICGFTWLLIYQHPKDKKKGKEIANFLRWAFTKGQDYCNELYYGKLPKQVQQLDLKQISKIDLK